MKAFSLILTVLVMVASAGCVSDKFSNEFAGVFAEAIVCRVVAPSVDLGVAAQAFHDDRDRWPTNYSELSAFNISRNGPAFTNYNRVDFSQTPDGGLEMLAFGAGTSNRITLHSTERK